MTRTDVYWNATWTTGLEHLVVTEDAAGVDADGLVLAHFEGRGLRLHYHVQCSPEWRAKLVEAHIEGQVTADLRLTADGQGGWRDATGRSLDDLAGCLDVDIMTTPFTNTLPIRRLNMAVGERQEIAVVYVKVPDLAIERAAQRYTLLAREGRNARYLYEGLGTDFKAELLVDEAGLVIDYQDLWQRIVP